jgi:soluble lytic murein transglycosylase-like protein
MVALLDTAGRIDLELERFESIAAGDHHSLLRVDARWVLAPGVTPPTPTLVVQHGAQRDRFEPLPGTGEDWRYDDERLWTAGFAVPLDLVLDARVRFWLEAAGPRYPLPRPDERPLFDGHRAQVVIRNGRPHLLLACGLMAVAIAPLAQPATVNAQEITPTETLAAQVSVPTETTPVEPAPAEAPAPAAAPALTTTAPPAPAAEELPVAPVAKAPKPKAKPKATKRAPKAKHHAAKKKKHKKAAKHTHHKRHAAPTKSTTPTTPIVGLGDPTPHVTEVPSPLLENFAIPPFLLPIYQAAGTQYDVPWQLLAAINEIETNYGRNLNVSSAGALGWMQFMPSTWAAYGVDANLDGQRDPFNPADAIFAAARYLHAAGASDSLTRAIFAYNHADWYVQSVLAKMRAVKKLPAGVVDSLTGLTQGRFPVAGKKVSYTRPDASRWDDGRFHGRRETHIRSAVGHHVIAVADGRVVAMGESRNGGWLVLEDAYGNRFTYGHLGAVARHYPTPKKRALTKHDIFRELHLPRDDERPARAASAGKPSKKVAFHAEAAPVVKTWPKGKERLFASPGRPAALRNGGQAQLDAAAPDSVMAAAARSLGLKPSEIVLRRLHRGSRVVAGTTIGRLGGRTTVEGRAAVHLRIHPAGKKAPAIDPTPLLDGWKLLQTTDVYGPAGSTTLSKRNSEMGIGRLLLMPKGSLAARVLADPRITIYEGGRNDIRAGLIDRRILATLAFLAESGLHPTVSCLMSGHSLYTASGNISEHSTGDAVDIAAINGTPIIGHQGAGSITETTIKRLLALQGGMKPHQIISLMTFDGADNTFAMGDHDDHIHVGFRPEGGRGKGSAVGRQVAEVLKPAQWSTLMGRLAALRNPKVASKPSRFALKVRKDER